MTVARQHMCILQPEAELGDSDSDDGSDENKLSKRKKKLESRLQIAELKQVQGILVKFAAFYIIVQHCTVACAKHHVQPLLQRASLLNQKLNNC